MRQPQNNGEPEGARPGAYEPAAALNPRDLFPSPDGLPALIPPARVHGEIPAAPGDAPARYPLQLGIDAPLRRPAH